ncbi:hypothetical protein [Crenobacter cavernae]|uniref:SnoaL-like domain-containing protein n=1 Tax=Crenobacter cavernae TaxID=2290923 RepID=A0ABY0FCG4_9NEIS|nr:hypothetical protein [Crenobacter cavernae]RXZ42024.1 hypothetical protein EBB06_13315 [Crenobacter cavernae]
MGRMLKVAGLVLALFLVAKYVVFREGAVASVLNEMNVALYGEGNAIKACDFLTRDFEFKAVGHRRPSPFSQGNREETCNFFGIVALPFKSGDVTADVRMDKLRVEVDPLSWNTARVTFTSTADMRFANVGGYQLVSEDEVTLVRTLDGYKIKAWQSRIVHEQGGRFY